MEGDITDEGQTREKVRKEKVLRGPTDLVMRRRPEVGIYKRKKEYLKTFFFSWSISCFLGQDLLFFLSFFLTLTLFLGRKCVFFLFLKSSFFKFPPSSGYG